MDHSNHVSSDMDHTEHSAGHASSYNNMMGFNLLWQSWKIENGSDLAWSCVVLFLISFFYEAVKVSREIIIKKTKTSTSSEFNPQTYMYP